ncbi:hypothetical protein [Candidatus Parabeggiatoa sp. HSG14]|nr:hypothetical protein [Thiotrichales bacterium HSG14]
MRQLFSVENLAESYRVEGNIQDESGILTGVLVEINGLETTTDK